MQRMQCCGTDTAVLPNMPLLESAVTSSVQASTPCVWYPASDLNLVFVTEQATAIERGKQQQGTCCIQWEAAGQLRLDPTSDERQPLIDGPELQLAR